MEDKNSLTFEQKLSNFDKIVATIRTGGLSFATSLELYEEALKVAEECFCDLADKKTKLKELKIQTDKIVNFEEDN
ncbi:MAG: exodeoxyribonuclease VII small subunit [Christensenellaceae bacterium]|nr:exodeoxyribonuclease VII small subunit [Christensenellaceae bacterium]